MAYDVFISYAKEDKIVADAVCATLESHAVRCWIAPRDVLPGVAYGEAIIDAIRGCRIMILVFSSKSNASPHIPKEIERAVSAGVAVIPFRIEDVLPGKSLDYFIGSVHWLDALTRPLEQHLERLVQNVQTLLSRDTAVIEPKKSSGNCGAGLIGRVKPRAPSMALCCVGYHGTSRDRVCCSVIRPEAIQNRADCSGSGQLDTCCGQRTASRGCIPTERNIERSQQRCCRCVETGRPGRRAKRT